MTILKLKQSENLSPRYFKGIKAGKKKGDSSVMVTGRLEDAKVFESFQESSLVAQKPELNYDYEQVSFYDEACAVLSKL